MDFQKQTIIDGVTVIDKALLDNIQDGVIEAITKAEETVGGANIDIDKTLTQEGKAADAKTVGDELKKRPTEFKTINGESITGTGEINLSVTRDQYKNLTGKTISFVADSITTFEGYIPEGYLNFYPKEGYDITDVKQTWWHQLLTVTGMKLHKNCAYAGSTVSGNSKGTAIVGCSDARVSDVAKNGVAPDIIMVMMGINDFNANTPVGTWDGTSIPSEGTINNFSEAYALLVKKLMTSYKNAEIFISTIPENANAGLDDNSLIEYNKAIRFIAESFGCKLVDMHACGITPYNLNYFLADGTHPKAAGARLLAKQAIAEISAKSINMHVVPSDEGYIPPSGPTVEQLCGNLEFSGTSNEFVQNTSCPVPVMVGYDKASKTTDLSGSTITKIQVRVKGNGQLTIGTCDLSKADEAGNAASFATKQTFDISGVESEGDFTTIECNIECGKNETLAFQDRTDTALCAISYAGKSGNKLDNVLKFEVCSAAGLGSYSQIQATSKLCLLGAVWGYKSDE